MFLWVTMDKLALPDDNELTQLFQGNYWTKVWDGGFLKIRPQRDQKFQSGIGFLQNPGIRGFSGPGLLKIFIPFLGTGSI